MTQLSKIESVQNSMVKHAYSLKIPKKSKDLEDFLCEGFHLVREALKSGLKCRFIFGTKGAWENPEGKDILASAHREKVKCFEVPSKIISYISDTVTPQGLLAVVGKLPSQWPIEPYSRVLAVFQVQDAGNMGTLFRSAEAFGFRGVLLTEGCCDPYNPKVVRSSMGSLFRVPFTQNEKWETCQDWLRQKQFHVYALAAQATQPLSQAKLSPPMAYWVGSEGAGLPEALIQSCEASVSIPMTGQVESLNVGVAASLAMFWAHFQTPLS